MKSYLLMTLILFLIMIFLPLITLFEASDKTVYTTTENTTEERTTKTAETAKNEAVTVMVSATGKLTEMSVENYIYGTVCAEMPASFHKEALKAQAVASYTYMKWLKENADNPTVITDNPDIHQAFAEEDELKERWGSSYSVYSEKVKDAVKSVLYEYVTYNGETAMTVFHGLSPGRTVSAANVWGNDVPYLSSVTATGDKLSPEITSTVIISKKDFIKKFSSEAEENAEDIIKNAKLSDDGFVNEIIYKNETHSSTDLRSLFKLKSPYFKLKTDKDNIVFTVYGKGHGVGMSQYSADYMARQGVTYKEILAHFYKGTELKTP